MQSLDGSRKCEGHLLTSKPHGLVRMYENCMKDSYATLVDERGHFVDTLGRVLEAGKTIRLKNGYNTEAYFYSTLSRAVQAAGLQLIFLPPGVRLKKAPTKMLDHLYVQMSKARLDSHSDLTGR
jgi:hypothetical protein